MRYGCQEKAQKYEGRRITPEALVKTELENYPNAGQD